MAAAPRALDPLRRRFDRFMKDPDPNLTLDTDGLRAAFIDAMLNYDDIQDLTWRLVDPKQQGARRLQEIARYAIDGGVDTAVRFLVPLLCALLCTGRPESATTGSRKQALLKSLVPVCS